MGGRWPRWESWEVGGVTVWGVGHGVGLEDRNHTEIWLEIWGMVCG